VSSHNVAVLAVSPAVTSLVHVAHAALVIVGAGVVAMMLSPLSRRRRRAAIAELRAAAACGNLIRLAELRAAGQLRRTTTPAYRPALLVAVAGSLVAAAVHAAVCPEHFREALRFGLFFIVLSLWQTGWSIRVLQRPSPQLYRLGVIVSASTVLLWAVTRTAGLPFGLADVEPVGGADLLATTAELITVAGCLLCCRSRRESCWPRPLHTVVQRRA
jgi:predicted nucleic acid-binding protein